MLFAVPLGTGYADLQFVTYAEMRRARFCLCPRGIAPTTRRLFESVALGCVPVLLADDLHVPFEDVVAVDDFVVRVKEKCAPWLPQILDEIDGAAWARRFDAMRGAAGGRRLLYLGEPRDAFASAMDLLRVKFLDHLPAPRRGTYATEKPKRRAAGLPPVPRWWYLTEEAEAKVVSTCGKVALKMAEERLGFRFEQHA